jgi:hypothetical protein
MTGINSVKQVPVLERYIVQLNRKQASAIFRLRCRTTRTEADMSSFATIPVCPVCNDGLASTRHYFTSCTGTEAERTQWGITNMEELYADNHDMETLRRYADFAIAVGIVPDTGA